jgi:hypothetical protein
MARLAWTVFQENLRNRATPSRRFRPFVEESSLFDDRKRIRGAAIFPNKSGIEACPVHVQDE